MSASTATAAKKSTPAPAPTLAPATESVVKHSLADVLAKVKEEHTSTLRNAVTIYRDAANKLAGDQRLSDVEVSALVHSLTQLHRTPEQLERDVAAIKQYRTNLHAAAVAQKQIDELESKMKGWEEEEQKLAKRLQEIRELRARLQPLHMDVAGQQQVAEDVKREHPVVLGDLIASLEAIRDTTKAETSNGQQAQTYQPKTVSNRVTETPPGMMQVPMNLGLLG